MDAHEILKRIQGHLDLVEWDADTLDEIAQVLRDAGYPVRDVDDMPPVEGPPRVLTEILEGG